MALKRIYVMRIAKERPRSGRIESECAIIGALAAVAQLAEQRTFNPRVAGSNPAGGTVEGLLDEGFAV